MTIEFDDDCQTDDEIKERACASLMRELKGGIERYNKAKKTGEKVILKDDTLMIIDYSLVESNFTLEDGRKISIELLNRCVLVNKH